VSDHVNVGNYTLEISGDELLVRDESGAIVEAVELDEINGQLTLPDGQKIDVASVLADAGIDLETAAGAANDNAGAAHGGSGFAAFHGASDRMTELKSAGTLDDTSLGFDLSLDVPPAANDFQVQQHSRSSFDWARHETSQGQPALPGGTGGSHDHPSRDDDDENTAPPSFPPLPNDDATGPGDDGDGDVSENNEQHQSTEPGGNDEPSVPPTDEQEQPTGEQQEDDPVTPPTDEQDQGSDEQDDQQAAAPPSDETAGDEPSDEPVTPPTDEQDQGSDEQQDEQVAAPPSDETDPPEGDEPSDEPVTPPTDEQDQGSDQQHDQQAAAPPSDETDPPEGDEPSGEPVTPPTDEQDQGAGEEQDQQSALPPSDEPDQPEGDSQSDDSGMAPSDEPDQPEDEPQDPPVEQSQPLVPQGNAAPTDIQLAGATVVENASGAVIGALSVVDPDVGDTHSFTVSDNRFEVVNGHLKLKDGISLDFEDKASIDITVTAKDSGGNELAEVFTISVGNVNEAPEVTAAGGHFDAKDSSSLQPTVDFSDVDSNTLSQAVIHTTGFQSGDVLNIPNSGAFNVTVNHGSADYTITITGKSGNETLDQYEDFANSISFSSTSKAEGDRHIEYSVTDNGGVSSNVASADIAVTVSHDLYTSQLGKGQTTLGAGDDLLHINSKSFSPVRMGDGYDTVHIEHQNRGFDHNDAIKLDNVEAIDTTGYGANKVSLSIHDVLNMTNDDNHLTIVGDQGDSVTLTGNGNNHWIAGASHDGFTTYTYSDGAMQAVVEVSNQMNTQVS
jgi:hypothetical protein